MTLSVEVYYYDKTSGEEKPFKDSYGVFGFEVARTQLWGAEIMKQLGLEILPLLEERSELIIEGEELDQLELEANLIIRNVDLILEKTKYGDITSRITNYAENLLRAVKLARECSGYVSIG
jgi:hypothetical protein